MKHILTYTLVLSALVLGYAQSECRGPLRSVAAGAAVGKATGRPGLGAATALTSGRRQERREARRADRRDRRDSRRNSMEHGQR